ncbi:hypothetical protein FSP39_019071 [Pinctada imbricata]|uniref:Ion transport domain-containing protein n=1 Tax=Pinctada imbricata TaxID=66713 RepID=A0AA88XT92_PINIB|nr:hypothetical protein FSP39_019071 [Pinctada imbricata]
MIKVLDKLGFSENLLNLKRLNVIKFNNREPDILFSDRCLELMTEMYDQNAKAAMKIVDTEVTIWGITSTPMTFAYENYEIDFVAHTCPQRRLNRIWYNKLAPDFVPFVKDLCSRPIEFFEAPLFRYLYHYILFLLMLIAFSAFVMTSVDDYYYRRPIARVWEYYIYIWAAGDLIEEIRNGLGIFITGGKTHRGYFSRAKRYLYDFWNAVDILSYLLLILALFTRHLWEPEPFTIARRMFSVSLLLMYLRYLQVFLMSRRLGPKLIMIKEMLKDLMYFLLIAFVVIIGVGIYYHANLYPNHINLAGEGNWDTWHIWKILYYPYWQLYGESFSEFLEDQEQSNCTSDRSMYEVSTDLERCAEKDPTVPIVSAIYMLISNLLLVNLVIAMFSYTFDAVTANAEKLWRFQKYVVITDYEEKIPSPFNLLLRLYQILKWAWKRFCCKGRCCFKTKEKNEEKDIKKESKRQFRLRFQKMIASEISSLKDTKL